MLSTENYQMETVFIYQWLWQHLNYPFFPQLSVTFNYQFPPPDKSHFLSPPHLKSKNSDVLFSVVPLLVYLSVFLQLAKLTGFLHPAVKKVLADQAFLSRGGERKVRLE